MYIYIYSNIVRMCSCRVEQIAVKFFRLSGQLSPKTTSGTSVHKTLIQADQKIKIKNQFRKPRDPNPFILVFIRIPKMFHKKSYSNPIQIILIFFQSWKNQFFYQKPDETTVWDSGRDLSHDASTITTIITTAQPWVRAPWVLTNITERGI